MSWLTGIRQRISEAVQPDRADRDLQDELHDHLEREIERQLADGVPIADARRRAIVRTGGAHQTREAARDERSGRIIGDAIGDLRIAARAARRNPAFTLAVVVSLALGVGGTTAVFSVVNAVLLRPLPYSQPDRLYMMRIWWKDFSSTLSPADFNAVLEQRADVASVGAYFPPDDGFAMATPDGPKLIEGSMMTAGLPGVLGVSPIAGAGFSQVPNAPEALIGEALWRERYGTSPAAIGQAIVLDGDSYTVVGVMPAGFNIPGQRNGQAWLKMLTRQPTRRGPFYYLTIVRVKEGNTPEGVAAALTSGVSAVLHERFGVEQNWQYRLRPLQDTMVANVRESLLLLLGAMALVMTIAVVNVANLFLARGTARTREIAVRASLGAGRGRLARHLLAEAALLGAIGGSAGMALAYVLLDLAGKEAVRVLPRVSELRADTAMAIFALVCGVGAGLIAGLIPALRVPWDRLVMSLREGDRSATGGPMHGRARQALVIAEIALTVTVLTGAVLLAKSMMRLQDVDPGFRPDGLASFRLTLPDNPYSNDERRAAFLTSLEEQLRRDVNASSVAFAFSLPPDLLVMSNNYTVEGEGAATGSAGASGVAEWNLVSEKYFRTMGIRLIDGRDFGSEDRPESPAVAVVNESFVRRHYPDGRAIGKRLKGGDWNPSEPWTTIVGVVADVPYGKGLWGGADMTVYLPLVQNRWVQSAYVLLQAPGDASRILPAVQQSVRRADPNLPVRDFAMMRERIHTSMLEPRLRSVLFTMIAALALVLSVTGIYGVMAYHVAQRRRETAIRRALGARVADVVGRTLAAGLRLTAAGIVLGTLGALLLTRSLSSMLFHVSPRDPATLVTVAALLTFASVLACSVPAFRSSQVDPASVLRDE
jgi:putative ABC transport system permease protein